jgi:pimeloyl-ACP methyl ester carboxylesterase
MAADPFSSNHVVPLSNYDGQGPAPVGKYEGITRDGIYDMAGNVREWTANPDGEARYIQGGGWDDPEYAFNDAVTSPVFDRSPGNGIRLVFYPDSTNVTLAARPIEKAFRDYDASVLIVGGLMMQSVQPVADPFNFLPRVTVPTLMVNGRYDSFFPVETSIMPLFEHLGTPEANRKIIVTDANHFVLAYEGNLTIAETLDWLDRYLGPVR